MAFAITKVVAKGKEYDEPLVNRFQQTLEMTITGTAADVALDFGNYTGTFWTAVGGTEPGITALKAIKNIQIKALTLVSASGNTLVTKQQAASTLAVATGQYKLTMNGTNNKLPDIALFAGEGSTAYEVVLVWELQDQTLPESVVVPDV